MKLAIIVGTRPEIIRLSATIKLAKKIFNTVLIHTGQNYDFNLNDVFFKDLSLDKVDYYLNCSRDDLGSTVGDIIAKSYKLFVEIKPDAILILGDTNSCLCAYSAKRLKIPIFHVEAGNRCFDPNVPEEINRRIIDHISDVNMCYMEHARRNLLQEGLKSQYIFVVGSPMREVIGSILPAIDSSEVLKDLNVEPKDYFVLSVHREENVNNELKLAKILDIVNNISNCYEKKIVFSVHPRTRKIINDKRISFGDKVILSQPFGLIDYCNLQKNALCVISDSGTLTEESSILQFPAVLLRDSTEHPEGIDSGNVNIGDTKWSNFKTNIDIAIQRTHWNEVNDYKDVTVSHKICSIISGYVGIVNKFVWMK
jgi:UDP-N-acetyl-L-fucosamine synthase